jgi:hypothetical protein
MNLKKLTSFLLNCADDIIYHQCEAINIKCKVKKGKGDFIRVDKRNDKPPHVISSYILTADVAKCKMVWYRSSSFMPGVKRQFMYCLQNVADDGPLYVTVTTYQCHKFRF